MRFYQLPRSVLLEFGSMMVLATLMAAGCMFVAGSPPAAAMALAERAGDAVGNAYIQTRLLRMLPVAVIAGVATIHLHAFFFMWVIRRHTEDQGEISQVRKAVWQCECISSLACMVTATLVFQLMAV